MRTRPVLPALLALALTASLAPAAGATPVTHTVVASLTNLTATVTGTLDVVVRTNLGNIPGSAVATGNLVSSGESGTVQLDWGHPEWNSQLDIAAGGASINTGPAGTANGNATLDLFGFIPFNFSLTINVDNISLGLATPYSSATSPLDPHTAGAGPWTALDVVDLVLGAQVDFNASGAFGINIGTSNIVIGPSVIPGIPLPISLERVGGTPGTGSQLSLNIPAGLELSIPPQPTSNIPTPGCEFGQTTFGCTLDVQSVDVTLTSLTFSNVMGTIVATSNTVVPEPSTLVMLGGGLAGLAQFGRRRAR